MISKDNYRLQLTIPKFWKLKYEYIYQRLCEEDILKAEEVKLNDFIKKCLERGLKEYRRDLREQIDAFKEANEIIEGLKEKWSKNNG